MTSSRPSQRCRTSRDAAAAEGTGTVVTEDEGHCDEDDGAPWDQGN